MDGTRHNDRQGLATIDNSADEAVGREVSRTSYGETAIRYPHRRQGAICPVIVPPNQYYVSRQASADFGDYWGLRQDPDGVLRDRLSEHERKQYLEDCGEQLYFVASLQPGKMLEVGCGPAWFLKEIQHPDDAEPWHIAGVEICEAVVHQLQQEEFEVYTKLEDVPGSWDVVRCHHVIEHMRYPILELEKMHAVLRPDGWLILSTPDFGGPSAARFGDNYRMLHDKTHCSLFTLESCHRFLRDHGFNIQHVSYPFPRRYMRKHTMDRWAEMDSPPWPGNWMTFYATRD